MDALETLAAQWIQEHPEYHALLADEDRALAHTAEQDPHNPFLHLSILLKVVTDLNYAEAILLTTY